MKQVKVSLLMLFLFSSGFLFAEDFDMKDPKGVNSILFSLNAPLEIINGVGDDISGSVSFDPSDAKAFKGKITLKATSLKATNAMMTTHLHGEMWLDVENNPEILVEFISVEDAKLVDGVHVLNVNAKVTIKGVSKEQSIEIKVTDMPGKLGERVKDKNGDLLGLRSTFSIKRSDFGLQSGKMENKVADDINITAFLIGHKFK